MVETRNHFANRLQSVGRKHAQMTHGYTTKVGKDGLIVVQPKRRKARSGGAFKLFILMAIGFFAFKAFTLAAIGPVSYSERLNKLENGTVIEQAGAKALAIDPLTEAVAEKVGPVLR